MILGGRKIVNLRYADNVTSMAVDEKEMAVSQRVKIENEYFSLYVNQEKTKIKVIKRAGDLSSY